MKTKIFIDFDGTLFDTEALKNELNQIVVDAGLTLDQVQSEYELWKRVHGHPDPEAMLQDIMTKYPGMNFEGAVEKTKAAIAECSKYLFPDVVDFLDKIDLDRFEPYLFTLGFEHWQKQKIMHCGIINKFGEDHVLYLQGVKADHLKRYVKPGEKFIIIDDSKDFTSAVCSVYRETATIIQMNRYSDSEEDKQEEKSDGINRITDLKDFSNIIPPIENGLNRA